ncbi:MAG: hypothetical protein F2754_08840 [Actinobacteria bacterium]|uniref:Unannotated protein n=1 Tax=freshwater metagenome TaxID=449393 RepID=A0A6J7PUU6_9ZZZZ|nr:hypothetical protein [Actinomycetota bacterium]MSW90460.1 hypothetical protein [Actinomycetota bacterium]MSX87476.1 hypothetical protein [Actinomycetota bacterium]
MPSFEHESPALTNVLPTCLADTLRPTLAARVLKVLARHGVAATIARRTTCCGQPAYNAGYESEARRVARPTVRALAKSQGQIVVPSGSCTAMMSRHWPALFAGTADETRARDVAARVIELSQALAAGSAPPAAGDRDKPVAYHGSCHLERELGERDAPRAALRAAGHEVREPTEGYLCCGFGGTFAVKLPAVSVAMADEKLDSLSATGATTVVGCDLSCLMHLEARARTRRLPLQFRHLAEQLTVRGDE